MLERLFSDVRTRVLAAFIVLLALSTLLSLLAIRQLLIVRTSDRIDHSLEQEAAEFRALSRGVDPRTGKLFRDDLEAIFRLYFTRNVPGEGETIVALVDGELFRTESGLRGGRADLRHAARRWSMLRRSEYGDLSAGGETVRYLAVPIRAGAANAGTFVVASAIGVERQEVDAAVRLAALVLLSVLLIASSLAWVVAGRTLEPLGRLATTAQAITESDLTRRIAVTGSDDIAKLSRTFNSMLDRLERAFEAQRSFITDASHELRTPITIVRANLELLSDDPGERREAVAVVTDELDRMTRFVDDLLLLAKAERHDFLAVGDVRLDALTDELFEKARALGARSWVLESRGEAMFVADRQRLTQAVMGLAQNAVQHTSDGDAIALGSAVAGGEVRLWVRDSGPGVPLDAQRRIFERFARSGDSPRRSDGAGLGLAIVRAIAEAHGGRVELASRPGAGAKFTVVIPAEHGDEPPRT
jgi:two-component system OmpR family sensor kinase